jgi:predicted Zn finger-like uncharacterized protein
MYIVCPKCETHFVIKPDQIGKSGRKAKCAKCKFIWFAEAAPLKQEHTSSIIDEVIPEGVNNNIKQTDTWLPAVVYSNQNKNDNSCLYQWALGLIALLALLLIEVVDHGYLGYNDNLMIKDTYITREGRDNVVVHYTIANHTKHQVSLPIIRFRFFNKHHEIIQRSLVKNNIVRIEPEQEVTLKREFKISNFSSFDVTLGSKIDFALKY